MADPQGGFRTGFRDSISDRRSEIVHRRSPDHPPIAVRGKGKVTPSTKSWSFTDAEMKRRKRIARYKVYTVEGRVKATFRRGIRWIKEKCADLVHGW